MGWSPLKKISHIVSYVDTVPYLTRTRSIEIGDWQSIGSTEFVFNFNQP